MHNKHEKCPYWMPGNILCEQLQWKIGPYLSLELSPDRRWLSEAIFDQVGTENEMRRHKCTHTNLYFKLQIPFQ